MLKNIRGKNNVSEKKMSVHDEAVKFINWSAATLEIAQLSKIASEMPVPHSLGKYFQHHEIQKYCISINFRILSEHCQLYKGPNNV